jgi:Leucine-rich repeat (LRR) protein
LPPLATLSALQTLRLSGCLLQQLPPLDNLTALRKLELWHNPQLQCLPPLDGLKALQTLDLTRCSELRQLPLLDGLTALQDLFLSRCEKLLGSCVKLPSTHESGVRVHAIHGGKLRVLQGEHVLE